MKLSEIKIGFMCKISKIAIFGYAQKGEKPFWHKKMPCIFCAGNFVSMHPENPPVEGFS